MFVVVWQVCELLRLRCMTNRIQVLCRPRGTPSVRQRICCSTAIKCRHRNFNFHFASLRTAHVRSSEGWPEAVDVTWSLMQGCSVPIRLNFRPARTARNDGV